MVFWQRDLVLLSVQSNSTSSSFKIILQDPIQTKILSTSDLSPSSSDYWGLFHLFPHTSACLEDACKYVYIVCQCLSLLQEGLCLAVLFYSGPLDSIRKICLLIGCPNKRSQTSRRKMQSMSYIHIFIPKIIYQQ